MTSFNTVPAGAQQQPTKFDVHVDEQKLQDFKTLLRLSPIGKDTFENLQDAGSHGRYGLSKKWLTDAKNYWEQKFDWRKEEDRINSFPNFKSTIKDDDGSTFDVHFVALFSSNPSAVPIAFYHGWPGSFLEFLPLLENIRQKYTPENLPYHFVVPSLVGYGLSAEPPLDKDWKVQDTSRIMHKLMLALGFGASGYLVQGGDIGAGVARCIAANYSECKGMHLNFMHAAGIEKKSSPEDEISEVEQKGLERSNEFFKTGRAYAIMHGTRPGTIGLVLSSSPIAMLAWIAEKFLAWSDPSCTPSVDTILADVTLYWLTGCFSTSIHPYRDVRPLWYVDKPVGYSYFPWELAPVPKAWAEKTGNMVFFKCHTKGGHFSALEQPEQLWEDVEEFVKIAWKPNGRGNL